jgi:hypothetical protein
MRLKFSLADIIKCYIDFVSPPSAGKKCIKVKESDIYNC